MNKLFGVVALVCCCLSTPAFAKKEGQVCNKDGGLPACDTGLTCLTSGRGTPDLGWCVRTSANNSTAAGAFCGTGVACGNTCVYLTYSGTGTKFDAGPYCMSGDAGGGSGGNAWAGQGFEQPCDSNNKITPQCASQWNGYSWTSYLNCNLSANAAPHAVANTCCVQAGSQCNVDNDCCTGSCIADSFPGTGHHCAYSVDSTPQVGGYCVTNWDCPSLNCVEGNWCACVPNGVAASNGADCCAGIGLNGSGDCACHVTGHTCSTNLECCNGTCSSGHCN